MLGGALAGRLSLKHEGTKVSRIRYRERIKIVRFFVPITRNFVQNVEDRNSE